MPAFICTACGTQYPPSDAPPSGCVICEEERQFVPLAAQGWTTLEALRVRNFNAWRQHEPGVIGIGTEPTFAIGQRALLIQTPHGNVLWDCISLIDDATVTLINGLGGLKAIAISHPHFYTTMTEWSRAFGGVPVHTHADEHFDLISQYAAELVKARVDVITSAGEEAIRAAQQATKAIPIVAMTDDMLGSSYVRSLGRPDGNTTGVSILAGDLDGKRQDILIEAVPGLRRMAALADVNNIPAKLDALQKAARAHNVELSIYSVARGDEIAAAIDRAQASGATALNVLASPLLWGNRQLIRDRVAALHLPAIFPFPEEAEEGGFAAYGPSLKQLFVEVMPQQIIKIFRGTKVADIPVEQPTKFELVINLKTANALGVTVPRHY